MTRNTTAVDTRHLRVKGQDICLTKNYFIAISIQKINLIHKFILKIQQILGSQNHAHPKIIKSTFSFPEFVPVWKKSVYSICSFLRYSQFQPPVTRLATPIFDHAHIKNFDQLLIFVNLYQHAKNHFIPSVHF